MGREHAIHVDAPACQEAAYGAFAFEKSADSLLERGISYVTMVCWTLVIRR